MRLDAEVIRVIRAHLLDIGIAAAGLGYVALSIALVVVQ